MFQLGIVSIVGSSRNKNCASMELILTPNAYILQVGNFINSKTFRMNPPQRKHQFQIRKVPLKRFIPEKTPELYALDVHSICLPAKGKNKQNWASLHSDNSSRNFQEDFNQQIVSSNAYKELYSQYLKLRDERLKEKALIQNDILVSEQTISKEKMELNRLFGIRDGLYTQIETLRDELTECRDKNYNLRWEVYNQRGTRYANLYGYSFLDPNELTYEELLQMEEQIGSVSKGLSAEEIEQLDKKQYICGADTEREICCICYDNIEDEDWVTVLKCTHTHHCDCIKDWLVKQKICPICKQEVVIARKKQTKVKVSRDQKDSEGDGSNQSEQQDNPEDPTM